MRIMMKTFLLLLLTELSFTCLLSFSIYGDRWWSHTHYKQWQTSRHILYYKQLINSLSLLINSLIKVVILNSWHDTHFKKKTSGFKNSVTQLQIETQLKKEIWWTMQVFLKARKDNFCYSSWLHPKKHHNLTYNSWSVTSRQNVSCQVWNAGDWYNMKMKFLEGKSPSH